MNPILITGALLGLLAVIVGAVAEHALIPGLSTDAVRGLDIAMAYHRFGALAILAIGMGLLLPLQLATRRVLKVAGLLLAAGTMLFSFPIYLGAATEITAMGRLTPLGGLMQMAGWAALVWVGWRARTSTERSGGMPQTVERGPQVTLERGK